MLVLAARTSAIVARYAMRPLVFVATVAAWTIAFAWSVVTAAALAVVLASLAVWRLGRPLPEPGARPFALRLRVPWGRTVAFALAGLHLRALLRMRSLASVALMAGGVTIALLAQLGWSHVEHDEPTAARGLVRGAAWCIVALGTTALPIARGLVAHDLARLDALPITTREQATAFIAIAAAPSLLGLALLCARVVPMSLALPACACALATCTCACARQVAANVARRGDARAFGVRWVPQVVVGTVIAVFAWPLLLVWCTIELVRLPGTIVRADAVRRRFELVREDHDHE
jgi:hypothetical protein